VLPGVVVDLRDWWVRFSGLGVAHRGDLPTHDVTIVEGLPVTTEVRTIADLLAAGTDLDHVAQMIGQGVRRGVVDLGDLASHLGPLASRHGQRDGHALVEYLLDVVGLSRAALTRELAASPAGQDLVEAGRLGALGEIIASMLPKIDTGKIGGLEAFAAPDVGKLSALSELIASMQPKIDTTKMSGLDKLDFDKLTNLHTLIANMSLTTPAFSQRMQEISRQLATSPRGEGNRRGRCVVEHASDPSWSSSPACANRQGCPVSDTGGQLNVRCLWQ